MAVKIGLNAPKFASKNDLNYFVGQRVAAVRKALRDAHDAQLLLSQFSTADLVAIGFTDGTNDVNNNPTPNEVGYLLGGLKCASSLYQLSQNTAPDIAAPHDYDAEMRYVAGTDN